MINEALMSIIFFLYLQKKHQWNEHLTYDISENKVVMPVGCMQRPLTTPAGYE